MDALCNYVGAGRTLQGSLTITFEIDEDPKLIQELDELKDQELMLEVSKVKKKHSDQARKYMWKLCDLIGKKIGSTKDIVYIMMLQRAGVFEYIEIPTQEISKIRKFFRHIEEIGTHTMYSYSADGEEIPIEISELRCYEGMHDYSTKELADLINEIVTECNALSIPTLTEEEFRRLAGI